VPAMGSEVSWIEPSSGYVDAAWISTSGFTVLYRWRVDAKMER